MKSHSLPVGRFAPSPSGDLHFGSLIAALGSFLSIRAQHGRWLVRIEDIDPPREVAGAAQRILRQLAAYGLEWDGEVTWQSQRHTTYREVLDWLQTHGHSYYCTCTRKMIQQSGGYYTGHCRNLNHRPQQAAIRLRQRQPVSEFIDRLRGLIQCDRQLASEDFILYRRDGLFAYNLAVTVDDHAAGITEIVRGADLIEPTVRQIALFQQLDWQVPDYLHLPLVCGPLGGKLSKQNHAPALPAGDPRPVLIKALHVLGQPIPDIWQDLSHKQLLDWAITHWQPKKIPVENSFLNTDALSPFSNRC